MTPSGSATDYRIRLSDAYVSTHFGMVRDPSLPGIERGFPFFRHHFLRHLPRDRGIAIVDLGCGYGSLLYALRAHGYDNVIGVDGSREQVALAGRLGIAGVLEEDVLHHLAARRASYDVIFAIDLLEHLATATVVELIDAAAVALKPGGQLIVQTVNAEGPFGGRLRYGDFTHELAFTPTSISQVLRLGGFGDVAVYPVEPAVHGLKSGVRWLLWQGIRSLLAAYLAVETGTLRGHIVSQTLIAVASAPSPLRRGQGGGVRNR